MADAETFGRETDGADTPCLRPAPFFKPLLTPLPIKSEKIQPSRVSGNAPFRHISLCSIS